MPPFQLIEADLRIYAKYFATYRPNIWFRPSWASVQNMMDTASDVYWVIQNGERLAGVTLTENTIGSIFMIPPHAFTVELAGFLKEQVLEISTDRSWVDADNVLSEHLEIFKGMGFQETVSRRCMIRPTEKVLFPAPEGFCPVPVTAESLPIVVSVMQEAYRSGTDERALNTYVQDTAYFFENNQEPHLLDASSIILDTDTHEPVGICLVSLWEDLPLIYEIAVLPAYRNRRLGNYMLCRAISRLEPFYPVIRLFVTSGNPAELLYSKLGFLSGGNYSTMVLEKGLGR